MLLALAGAVFLPVLGLAVLGFVVTGAVIMSRATPQWAYVWVTAFAGVIWLAAIVSYWVLWTSASNFADDLKPIPGAIQVG